MLENGMLQPLPWEYGPVECQHCGEYYERELIDTEGICAYCEPGDDVDPIIEYLWELREEEGK